MNNFDYTIPTLIHFGKGAISHLTEIAAYGKKVLLVYGGGSIKRSGLYDTAMALLKGAGVAVCELGGVEPNPRIESVRKGVQICQKEGVDAVLAVGGGSAIDCAKVIAAGTKYAGDAWDLVLDSGLIKGSLPVFSVLTLSATGSEMDPFAVISDLGKKQKLAVASAHVTPKMSILDPTYTFTVPKNQTAAGTADIISHTFENYFTNVTGAYVQARLAEALLKTCFHYGPIALEKPDDYEARANLMWASSLAINGLIKYGAEVDWTVHPMEHELSAFYDITHGEGLAILTPHWMRKVLNERTIEQFVQYGINVWGIDATLSKEAIAAQAIDRTAAFFKEMGLPTTLGEVGIADETNFRTMAENCQPALKGALVNLSVEDVVDIYRAAK
ncbi:MAG: iron-containing alcohol dehydrogenase [Clostridia bacterium]